MCVGRCASEPYLGAFRSVDGPIKRSICVGRGDLMAGGVPDEPNSTLLGYDEVLDKATNLRDSSMGWLLVSPDRPEEVLRHHGGLVMMTSTPAGKACMNSAGVMVLASMGRRVSHPNVASRGRRRGCRLCSHASLWVVAVCASGSVSARVYDVRAWPAFNIASSPVAMSPQSSTRWMGR